MKVFASLILASNALKIGRKHRGRHYPASESSGDFHPLPPFTSSMGSSKDSYYPPTTMPPMDSHKPEPADMYNPPMGSHTYHPPMDKYPPPHDNHQDMYSPMDTYHHTPSPMGTEHHYPPMGSKGTSSFEPDSMFHGEHDSMYHGDHNHHDMNSPTGTYHEPATYYSEPGSYHEPAGMYNPPMGSYQDPGHYDIPTFDHHTPTTTKPYDTAAATMGSHDFGTGPAGDAFDIPTFPPSTTMTMANSSATMATHPPGIMETTGAGPVVDAVASTLNSVMGAFGVNTKVPTDFTPTGEVRTEENDGPSPECLECAATIEECKPFIANPMSATEKCKETAMRTCLPCSKPEHH